ncbi:substrate-binding domain-containing protein [Phyllobacterium endophyticum]|uniref:Transcriptional regulator LacI/GalR-like sensor domain-containing protein n=1 Tax=Phyllobacterium endophyticum TaxID=1149773 RepID=A0A2P7AK63_9HYPH|nr:LacI family DNA-binding transcriptional regulator [Phyllobacterium endophyticum]MBB3237177.1 DNA-binding LacI/PurR family transcriptional regulator [Phyllobacterium endophyticum]PSH54606.1 hypothetical protein CU100_25825 [Phyllobacterium endophyticum]TYR40626.1 LacI family transcriptional regulator [Phyllobacterium endophyticum]
MLERALIDHLGKAGAVNDDGGPAGPIVIAVDTLGANLELLSQLAIKTRKRGFRPLFLEAAADLSFADVSAIVPSVRGVILATDIVNPEAFANADRPIVLVADSIRNGTLVDQLIHDAEQAGYWAAEYIASAGRISVAIIGQYDPSRPAFRGFLKGVSTYDLVVRGEHIVECIDDRPAAAERFKSFLTQVSALPQAVYCTSGDVACGVYEALLAAGFSVPNDMWIIGNGSSHMTGAPFYDITTIAPPNDVLAAEAIDLLCAHVEAAGRRPEIRRVSYRTTPGVTTDYFNVVRSTR